MTYQEAYQALQDYIANEPSIEISDSCVMVPKEVHPELNKRIDAFKYAYIQDQYADVIRFGEELQAKLLPLKASFQELSGLTIGTDYPELSWFLEDPTKGLGRMISNQTRDVVYKRIAFEEYENRCKRVLNSTVKMVKHFGVMRFIEFSLMLKYAPTKSYWVPVVDNIEDNCLGEGHENPGLHVGNVPFTMQNNIVNFNSNPFISFNVPNYILKNDSKPYYLGFKDNIVEAEWTAKGLDTELEFISITELKARYNLSNSRPDMTKKGSYEMDAVLPSLLIYADTSAEKIRLVADYVSILRPTICVELVEEDILTDERLAHIIRQNEALRPKLGTYVVFNGEAPILPEADPDTAPIFFIKGGYDHEALNVIVDSIDASYPTE